MNKHAFKTFILFNCCNCDMSTYCKHKRYVILKYTVLYNCNIGHWIAMHSSVQPTLCTEEFQSDARDALICRQYFKTQA